MRSPAAELQMTSILTADPWYVEPVAGGTLILNGAESAAAGVAVLHKVAQNAANPNTLLLPDDFEVLSEVGERAVTHRAASLVAKVFRNHRRFADGVSGVGYLQASVALHEGLELARQEGSDAPFVYSAPKMYGLLLPTYPDSPFAPVSLMSFEPGEYSEPGGELTEPPFDIRQAACQMALAAAGLPPQQICIDSSSSNTLLHPLDARTVQVTQLDVTSFADGLHPVST